MVRQSKRYRSVRYVVACSPWESAPYIDSEHRTSQAAQMAADKANQSFSQHNGATAYGYNWVAGVTRVGETARVAAIRITGQEGLFYAD